MYLYCAPHLLICWVFSANFCKKSKNNQNFNDKANFHAQCSTYLKHTRRIKRRTCPYTWHEVIQREQRVTPVILQLCTLEGQSSVTNHAPFPSSSSPCYYSRSLIFFTSIYSSPLSIIHFHPLFTTLHVILNFSFLSLIFFIFVFLRSHFGISSFITFFPDFYINISISPFLSSAQLASRTDTAHYTTSYEVLRFPRITLCTVLEVCSGNFEAGIPEHAGFRAGSLPAPEAT